jgi:hypothetical protein
VVVDESFRSRKYGMGIVKSIAQTIDENDELCHRVDIYQYGNLNTYYLYNSDFDINSISAASSAFIYPTKSGSTSLFIFCCMRFFLI